MGQAVPHVTKDANISLTVLDNLSHCSCIAGGRIRPCFGSERCLLVLAVDELRDKSSLRPGNLMLCRSRSTSGQRANSRTSHRS